jgi:hypothetical protein
MFQSRIRKLATYRAIVGSVFGAVRVEIVESDWMNEKDARSGIVPSTYSAPLLPYYY